MSTQMYWQDQGKPYVSPLVFLGRLQLVPDGAGMVSYLPFHIKETDLVEVIDGYQILLFWNENPSCPSSGLWDAFLFPRQNH